jgi:hypothetical protein
VGQQENIGVAGEFLARLGGGASPEEVAKLFSPDADWEIPGDIGALPWIGRKKGREAVADFVRDSRGLIERLRFEVQGMFADDHRAIILGELASRLNSTGKTIETAFALVLTISGGQITRFQMLEDSFATSEAARP